MKISLPALFLSLALVAAPKIAVADAGTPSTSTTSPGTTTPTGQPKDHLKKMLAQLNLTDAQKKQIEQIRATVTDRKERRQDIMKVLTPDQLAKLKELRAEHKQGTSPSSTPSTT